MFKNFFKKDDNEKDKKRQMENIVIFIIILIITVLVINNMWSTTSKEDGNNNTQNTSKVLANTNATEEYNNENLEKKLEEILGSIDGVGNVKVLIKYSESSSVVAMYNETTTENTTTENEKDGSSKDVKETESKKEVVYSDEDGESKPITEKIIMPVIEGAVITAQGANDSSIKASIVSAVEAVTGLAVHKIQVFEMGSN